MYVTSSGRDVKMTEKMKSYQLQLACKSYDQSVKRLNEKLNAVQSATQENPPNISHIQAVYEDVIQTYNDVMADEEELLLYMPPEGREQHSVAHTKITRRFSEIQQVATELVSAKREPSIAVSHSSYRFGSIKSTASLLRLKEDQLRAELMAKASALKQQRSLKIHHERIKAEQAYKQEELERKRKLQEEEFQAESHRLQEEMEASMQELKDLEEEFAIKTEIAMSDARSNVLRKYEQCNNDQDQPEMKFASEGHASVRFTPNPNARPFIPLSLNRDRPEPMYGSTPAGYQQTEPFPEIPIFQNATASLGRRNEPVYTKHSCGSGNDLSKLVEALSRQNINLPSLEPEVFDGDIMHYSQWMSSFESLVEENVSSPVQRLYYLGKYTNGEARNAIQALLSLKSPTAYRDAKMILNEQYGNKYRMYEAFKKKIHTWPSLKGKGEELRKFSDFLSTCQSAMGTIQYLKVLDDAEESQKLVWKLPRYMAERRRRVADTWLHGGNNMEEAFYPPFTVFCDFITTEARIACGPIRLKNNEDKSTSRLSHAKKVQPPSARSFSTVTHGEQSKKGLANTDGDGAPGTKPKTWPCPVCKSKPGHGVDICPEFLRMNLEGRVAAVKANRLCLRCLKWGHKGKECRGNVKCEKCGRGHQTLLHDDHFQTPATEKDADCPKETSPGQSVLDPHQATSYKIEATTGHVKDSVSSSLIVLVYLLKKDCPKSRVLVYALLDTQSNSCFVSNRILEVLGAKGLNVHLKLQTMLVRASC